jgi:hypothetical protein
VAQHFDVTSHVINCRIFDKLNFREYAELGKCPLVMIVGEDQIFSKLMPDHLLMRLKVEMIG